MRCPNCHDCAFERGVCERLANRGRRFFLMGALALPVAAKIERIAPIVAPKLAALPTSSMNVILDGKIIAWLTAPMAVSYALNVAWHEKSFPVQVTR